MQAYPFLAQQLVLALQGNLGFCLSWHDECILRSIGLLQHLTSWKGKVQQCSRDAALMSSSRRQQGTAVMSISKFRCKCCFPRFFEELAWCAKSKPTSKLEGAGPGS